MLSLSDNELSVINFLVRNFTERLTIRSIAQRLEFSPAGVFNILKKLEKQNIVTGQKFGTGLFYSINFGNTIAGHLAAIVLIYSDEKYDKIDLEQLKQAKAVLYDKKNLLVVGDNVSISEINLPNANIITKTEDELVESFRKKDSDALQVLKKGAVLRGEEIIVNAIKNSITRF